MARECFQKKHAFVVSHVFRFLLLIATSVSFYNFAYGLNATPLGGQSLVSTTELGRRVVLKWPLPALYPRLTIGGLVCVASGQAPLAVDVKYSDESIEPVEIESVSPLCVAIRRFTVKDSSPLRFLISFEYHDAAQIPVFPETGPRRDRYDFVTESEGKSIAVLQLIDYRKNGATHAGVLCTTIQGRIKNVSLARGGSSEVTTIPTVMRADGCFALNALAFQNSRPTEWILSIKMANNEHFMFALATD